MDIFNDFSVDYWINANDKIQDIHNYLMKKNNIVENVWVCKKIFVVTMTFLVLSVNSLECVSMNNQECKVREEIISVNNKEPVFYPFSVKVNKCSGSCNNINNPYAR